MVSAYETPQDFPGGPVVSRKTPNAEDMGSIPGWVTKILHVTWHGLKMK